ncbi:PREDICTED: protein SLOW GREEN 1, chloroplastic [Ipomoea nil]|uniref:protein SLOW GREEN 1, chloroplastic n=1 Tax=Ipomoea nil TaxID=35883 RepID=UPI000900C3CE|nr:PREDICTED: protein SLOW GREEN 1, chloroplastic [Ipomoea nil]
MELSGITLGASSSTFHFPKTAQKPHALSRCRLSAPCSNNNKRFTVRASATSDRNPLIATLKSAGVAAVFAAVTFGKFPSMPPLARAEPAVVEEQREVVKELEEKEEDSPLTQFLESSPEAVESLKALLQEKVEAGEDEESLELLHKLAAAQPENTEWKFMTARLYHKMGKVQESRAVFEEVLSGNPLSFEALFENALLMDRSGEGEKVLERLEEALKVAEEESRAKEARDVKLIMAQMKFLQKNVEGALRSYDELVSEDPSDFRPYFCKGVIYSLLDRNEEAREQFAKYRELSPKKFEVEGYLRSPLSRMKLFGMDEDRK